MCVALRRGTAGFILDGSDQAEESCAISALVNSLPIGSIELRERFLLCMARRAGFCSFVHQCAGLMTGRRKADPSIGIENANSRDPGFPADRADNLVDLVTMVLHHAVTCTPLNRVTDAVSANEGHFLEMLLLHLDCLPA